MNFDRFKQLRRTLNALSSQEVPFFLPDRFIIPLCVETSELNPNSYPAISYATTAGNPWTSAYLDESDGHDETFHVTTTSNATIALNITGKSPL